MGLLLGLSGTVAAQDAYQRALEAYRAGNHARAIDGLEQAQRAGNKAAGMKLGECYFQQGAFDKAAAQFQKAMQDAPTDVEARRWLGETYLASGQTAAALKLYQEAAPKDSSFLAGLGRAYASGNQWGPATDAYRQALQNYPKDPGALAGLGDVYSNTRDWPKAIETYAKALELTSNNPAFHLAYATALDHVGNSQEAIKQYRLAIRNEPKTQPATYRRFGEVLATEGQWDEALAAWDHVIASGAADDAMMSSGYSTFERQKKWTEAAAWLRRVLAAAPKLAVASSYLGQAELELQHWPEAGAAFEASLQIRKDLAAAWDGRGRVRAHAGQWDEASADFLEAAKLDTAKMEIRRRLADAYFNASNWLASIDAHRYVLEKEPSNTAARQRPAQSYLKADQLDKAEVEFNGILQTNAKSVEALRGLGDVRYAQKKFDEAAGLYERALAIAPVRGSKTGAG